jgi:hypothetical protein
MILIGTGSVDLILLPERFRFASASRNVRSFANDLPIGMAFTGQQSERVDCHTQKRGSNTSRKVLEKHVDAGENRKLPKN